MNLKLEYVKTKSQYSIVFGDTFDVIGKYNKSVSNLLARVKIKTIYEQFS